MAAFAGCLAPGAHAADLYREAPAGQSFASLYARQTDSAWSAQADERLRFAAWDAGQGPEQRPRPARRVREQPPPAAERASSHDAMLVLALAWLSRMFGR